MDNVLSWDENKVGKWLVSIGYSAYEKQFKEHGITGDVLVNLDHETLKDLAMHSVGQRMEILKHIYTLKALWRIPLNEWDYVPPSVLYENDWLGQNGMADYRKIEAAFQERDGHLKQLTEELHRVSNEVFRLREELNQLWKVPKDKKSPSTPPVQKAHQHFLPHKPGQQLLTPPILSAASHSGGDYFSSPLYSSAPSSSTYDTKITNEDLKPTPSVMVNDGGAIKVYGEKISNSSKVELESSKNVRLLLDDPCSRVITSALKKYNVVDDWQQYSLWIQYGPHDNIQERQLGYDETPLRISQKLKEAKQNPVFVLKHVKDNKPFNPSQLPLTDSNKAESNTNMSSRSGNLLMNPFTSPRPAPKPSQLYGGTSSTDDITDHPNGARGAPLSASSAGWKPSPPPPPPSDKRTMEHPKTAITSGRVDMKMVVPIISSSISTPTQSTTSSLSPPSTLAPHSAAIDNSSSQPSSTPCTGLTPSSIKRAGTINRKPSDSFLSELGLESGMANAIYTIMMEQGNQNGN